jgi:hypothetical protein
MHFACMQPAGALLTKGWAFSFGSPNLFRFPPGS